MGDGGLTGLALDPVLEILYNLYASCRVPKISHRLEFRDSNEDPGE